MRFLLILLAAAIFSCSKPVELKTGTWRGVIDCQGHDLPFTFDVVKKSDSLLVYLKNGSEKILLDEISVFGDSVKMVLHIFDAEIHAKIDGDKLKGTFIKNYATQANQPFSATFGEDYRFAKNTSEKTTDFSGKYQVEFKTPKGKIIPSVGIFEQDGNHLTGSFLTPTGDYRYLEGIVTKDSLYLSCFDGGHAMLLTAKIESKNKISGGTFYSGAFQNARA